MSLTIHIPRLIIWMVGIGVGLVVLAFAAFGVVAMGVLNEQQRSLGRWFGW